MIASIRGTVISVSSDAAVVEAGGVGYEIHMTPGELSVLPRRGGATALVHISESYGLYGGKPTLYGFLDPAQKEMFELLKDSVPNAGAKKAMELLEKAAKSLPDFKRAVLERDPKILQAVFGFTKKTAENLIAALKDKLPDGKSSGAGPRVLAGDGYSEGFTGRLSEAIAALESLGYRTSEARAAVESVLGGDGGRPAGSLKTEDILKLALKRL